MKTPEKKSKMISDLPCWAMRKWNMTTKTLPKDSSKVRAVASVPRGNFWTLSQPLGTPNYALNP